MSVRRRWSRPEDITAAVRRRWDDGSLLRAFAAGEPFPEIDVPLSGPTARQLGEDIAGARAWAAALERGSREGRAYTLVTGHVGGREVGRTTLPVRARLTEYAQAWMLLGSAAAADEYRHLVGLAAGMPAAQQWAVAKPLRALAVAGDWPAILAAVQRLETIRGSGRFLRQISAPGVHTKLIESRRAVIAEILGVPSSSRGFIESLGLAQKPTFVRIRFASGAFGFPDGVTEALLRTDELGRLDLRPAAALIVENEVSYLSVPVPVGGIVLWGKGYDADQAASLAWLTEVPVRYWGDLDTHGFAILNRVRTRLPQTRSILMDRATLLAHEDRWGTESAPSTAALGALDAQDGAVYEDLVTDRLGHAVRLEQELLDWDWVLGALDGS